ncbi:MAG TPA: hypothetical protein DEQ09_06320 [Bacteroidales bacterium]|nr:hypothetical protein [Bacteroidales bacterium]
MIMKTRTRPKKIPGKYTFHWFFHEGDFVYWIKIVNKVEKVEMVEKVEGEGWGNYLANYIS